jgi:hypothetical protein
MPDSAHPSVVGRTGRNPPLLRETNRQQKESTRHVSINDKGYGERIKAWEKERCQQ